MFGTIRIKLPPTLRTNRTAVEIIRNSQLISAAAAENCAGLKLVGRPNFRRVTGKFGVTLKTRKPAVTAFEFNGDHVQIAVIMSAPRFCVNFAAVNFFAVNFSHNLKTPPMMNKIVHRRRHLNRAGSTAKSMFVLQSQLQKILEQNASVA